MIVSLSHKFIFVHIPKNGGTTIETLLMEHIDPEMDLHVSEAAEIADNRDVVGTKERAKLKKHITAPLLRKALPKGHYDLLFSFAFSRNPYSRCFSAFNYITARAEKDLRAMKQSPASKPKQDRSKFTELTFDEVCTDLDGIAAKHGLFRPQTFWLPEADSVDYVGRLENLSEDLRFVYNHIGLPTEKLDELPVANMKSAKGAWRGMAPASAAAIREFYAEDFERFGYDLNFEGKDQAPARAPIVRGEFRAESTLPTTWTHHKKAQSTGRLRRAVRPPKPLRTRAERGLE